MRKEIIISAIVLVLFLCNFKFLPAQSYYVLAGTNFSRLYQLEEEPIGELSRTIKPGLQIGPSVEFKINNTISISPGIYLSLQREYTESSTIIELPYPTNDLLFESKSSFNRLSIDLPLSLKLEYSFNNSVIFCLTGPYINVLVADKDKSELYLDGALLSDPVEIGEEKFSNRIDYGINLGVGVEFKSYILQLSYDYGFYHKLRYENFENNEKVRNLVFRISLGYKLL